jgi:pimeloyl-ACP methyl ester carboxylesterase
MVYSTLVKTFFRALYGEPPELSNDGEGRGLVLVADGVGGLDLCGTALRYVMGAQGLPFTVKVVPWGHGLGRWHADLTNAANRDARGRQVAEEVRAFRAKGTGGPVYLVGKSGGTGVVVRALEALPEDSVDVAVLIAPAISPDYDLTRALRAVRREMVVFWSPLDLIILGAGTRIFGTIDRVKTVSAGLVGFRPPRPAQGASAAPDQAAQYAKLRQVRWGPAMCSTGYLGGHVGPDSPAFLRKYVVPLLRASEAPRG